MTREPIADRTISQKQQEVENDLINRVVASFDDCENSRLKFLMRRMTHYLHDFVRDVRLTENEWNAAIEFLTEVGQITDDNRQEFVLLSDVLGVSMQTIAVNNEAFEGATEATVFGPFFVEDAPEIERGGDMAFGAEGQPAWVEGVVTDTGGVPVSNARIEVWECDEDGLYDVQYSDGRVAGRAYLHTDEFGRYQFWGLTPVPYSIPDDGPVGKMLQSVGRSPVRTAHLHFMVTAPSKRTLVALHK